MCIRLLLLYLSLLPLSLCPCIIVVLADQWHLQIKYVTLLSYIFNICIYIYKCCLCVFFLEQCACLVEAQREVKWVSRIGVAGWSWHGACCGLSFHCRVGTFNQFLPIMLCCRSYALLWMYKTAEHVLLFSIMSLWIFIMGECFLHKSDSLWTLQLLHNAIVSQGPRSDNF